MNKASNNFTGGKLGGLVNDEQGFARAGDVLKNIGPGPRSTQGHPTKTISSGTFPSTHAGG